MTASLSSLLTLHVYTYLLVLCRVGGVFFLMPGFGESFIPARVRLVAALTVSLVLTPPQIGAVVAVPPPGLLAAQVGADGLRRILNAPDAPPERAPGAASEGAAA